MMALFHSRFENMPQQNKFEHLSFRSAQQIHQNNLKHCHISLLS